jgi:hypothetical protein
LLPLKSGNNMLFAIHGAAGWMSFPSCCGTMIVLLARFKSAVFRPSAQVDAATPLKSYGFGLN